jgi:hypothetical protein
MAWAATATYPAGGSGFQEDAEGWSVGGASCTPAELLCSSAGVYDMTAGNPPGSIAANTTATVNLVALFKGAVSWVSPQFTIPVEAITGAELHLERAFDPGGLIDVEPVATYDVVLEDITAGSSTTALSGEADEGDEAFAGNGAPVAVVAGHNYRLAIESTTVQSTLSLTPLGGTTSLRFDNVGLSVQSSEPASGGGGGGGDGGNGDGTSAAAGSAGTLSSEELLASVRREDQALAELRARRVFVRVGCPHRARRSCRITVQGAIRKHVRVTRRTTVKVASGKRRLVGLWVKPRFRDKVAVRRRLLIVQKVRVGSVTARFARSRALVRRG